jgi:hypothetical protein
MASVPVGVPFLSAVASRCGAAALDWVFHERKTSYPAPRLASGGSLDRGTRSRRPLPATVSAPVGLHLKPGQKGTKRLVERYGDRLVCVRYRYDAARRKRIKTVELVVAEADWEPRFAPDQIVALRVAFTDVTTRTRVKRAGGTWDPDRVVWQLRYDRVVALGLRRRIVPPRHPEWDARHPVVDARTRSAEQSNSSSPHGKGLGVT